MTKLVLLRHGESTWNLENRFTGWTDVDLSPKGVEEGKDAGRVMKKEGYTFDVAYTSVLKRAIKTLTFALDEMDLWWIPVTKSWRLNERHYGDLQGLDKAETQKKFGEQQVTLWRRSYDVPPPPLAESDPRNPAKDLRYAGLSKSELVLTESLKETVARFVPYYESVILPDLKAGKKVIIAAHGNSLRALVKYLDGMTEADVIKLNIPTGTPLVYELDDKFKPIRHYYLGDQERIKAAIEGVANQTKGK